MEFSAEEKVSIANLVKGGFPESMAKTAVAAKSAGLESAIDDTAAFVKLMAKGEDMTKAEIESRKKALRDQLKALEAGGDRSPEAAQKRITIKNALARLG